MTKKHRHQTQTERDISGLAAREERDAARENADGVPEPVTYEDVTGQAEGDALRALRARRPTGERLERLEVKHDALVKDVTETRVDVGKIKGQLEVLPELVSLIKGITERREQRDVVAFTASVDVDTAAKTAAIDIDAAAKKAEVAVGAAVKKAEVFDGLDAKKARRARVTKIVTSIIGMVGSGAVLHWLLERL